jgi:hypothetical protein
MNLSKITIVIVLIFFPTGFLLGMEEKELLAKLEVLSVLVNRVSLLETDNEQLKKRNEELEKRSDTMQAILESHTKVMKQMVESKEDQSKEEPYKKKKTSKKEVRKRSRSLSNSKSMRNLLGRKQSSDEIKN